MNDGAGILSVSILLESSIMLAAPSLICSSIDELCEIGIRYLKTIGHTFSLDGLASFKEELTATMSGSSKSSWANARSVKNMIEHIYIKRAMRYSKDGKLDREITEEDICSIPYERRNKIGF